MARGATAKDKSANRRRAQRRQPTSPAKARSLGRRRAEATKSAGNTRNRRARATQLAAVRDAR